MRATGICEVGMLTNRYIIITVFTIGVLLAGLLLPYESHAFPLRIGEDCFYGNGEAVSTSGDDRMEDWMGYAVEFNPPYLPYTVDSISFYISDMRLANGEDRTLKISVVDANGVVHQRTQASWRALKNHSGWVMLDVGDYTYNGMFTVILHSGVDLPSNINAPPAAVFRLGIDPSELICHSYYYTDCTPPNSAPALNVSDAELARRASSTISKLTNCANNNFGFPGGNWMIRAQSPGLQLESTNIYIDNALIQRRFYTQPDFGSIQYPDWHMPPVEGLGPRGTVHCPTSLSGITFYYYQDELSRKFLTPHEGPWIHPDLVNALGRLCRDLYAEGIVGIEHIGIYNDRNIAGTNTKSSHAYGLGLDISGFQFADGRVIMVEDHDDPEVRATLEHIRNNYLEKYFPTVLDWNYQNHDNHFHINLPYNQ